MLSTVPSAGGSVVVAVTRVAGSLENLVAPLSEALGVAAFDVKSRLSGGLPAVIGYADQPQDALRLLKLIRDRGHGAVACQASHITSARTAFGVKRFQLTREAFVAYSPSGGCQLPFDELLIMVDTLSRRQGSSMGGEARSPTARFSSAPPPSMASDQRCLYLFRKSGRDTIIIGESEALFDGLGDQAQPTKRANYEHLVNLLRRLAPHARYDSSLVASHKRGSGMHRAVTSSPSGTRIRLGDGTIDPTDLAAHLLAIAQLQGQLAS